MSESKTSHGRDKRRPNSTAAQNPDPAMAAAPPKWRWPLIWVLMVLALDLGSKALALAYINPWTPIEVIPGFFNLVLAFNTGGAFSLFAGEGQAQGLKMAALATAALLPFIYFYIKASPGDRSLLTSLGLVWGGALGNIHDRLRWNGVVDFLDFYWNDYHWPAFNVADIAICLGAGLLALSILREKPPVKVGGDAA